jgi:NDP-sugar pyrophosphorylase family protein
MKIIIPMAGSGNRFVQAGYTDPKPLIKVDGKRIVEYILDSFDRFHDEFVFICNETHLKTTNIKEVLLELCPGSTVLSMPDHKLGPVHTVQAAYKHIKDNEEVLVSYCDNAWVWDRESFQKHLDFWKLDGCILTHSGFHPHTLNNTKMAFMKTDKERVLEVKEKACYTSDPQQEHASTGAYYFKTGKMLKKYFDQSVAEENVYNGEYYVTLVYNLLIKDGLKVGHYDTPYVVVLGTPEEVKNYEAWAFLCKQPHLRTVRDLEDCADYWKGYYEIRPEPRAAGDLR